MIAAPPVSKQLAKFRSKEAKFAGAAPRLVVLGDSHAAGWPNGLLAAFGLKPVAKLAITSLLTEELLYTVQNSSVDYSHAEAVIIQIGANNLRNYVHRATPYATPTKIAQGIAQIARLLRDRAPNADIFVMNVIQGQESASFTETGRTDLNRMLQGLAAETGLFVYVESAPMQPTDAETYEPDQIHLLPAGYARFLRPALMNALAGVKRAGA